MVDGTSAASGNDAASSADATHTDTTPGRKPASATPVATPAEGTASTPTPAEAQSTNPVNAPAGPASRRGLSKLAFVAALMDWAWTDLDGEP